jgi:hypothetical protein
MTILIVQIQGYIARLFSIEYNKLSYYSPSMSNVLRSYEFYFITYTIFNMLNDLESGLVMLI